MARSIFQSSVSKIILWLSQPSSTCYEQIYDVHEYSNTYFGSGFSIDIDIVAINVHTRTVWSNGFNVCDL